MGFAGYFLIVADFIKWAKANDIPVGPGRGSGAGSVVAWALTITDLDPIELNLLFERFLNPERVSMPDFDIDFLRNPARQGDTYVQGKYGRDKVAQIITFGRLKARAVLKDTGRVLQMSYGQVDRLAKLIPNHPTDPWTLERSLNGVSELRRRVQGRFRRQAAVRPGDEAGGPAAPRSTHAAGVVIGDRPLDELVPLYRDPRSDMPVTQFDMKYVEAAGLVKFDFLGLKTLSVLKEGQRLLAERGVEVDFDRCPGTTRRSTSCSSAATRSACSSWNRKACAARCGGPADRLRRHHRARLALPARPDGQHPDVRRPQERPRRRSNIRTRCSRRCSRKPTASSSIRNR
jgi:DNA polymerase III subunit alpha